MMKSLPSFTGHPHAASLRNCAHHTRLLLVCLLLTSVANAQVQLVKDINQNHNPEDREYREAVDRSGNLIFVSGNELWKTAGSPANTIKLKTFNSIGNLVTLAGLTYFYAFDGTTGALWKTNGSVSGTVKVKDVPYLEQLTVAGTMLYFVGLDNIHGRELWKSDGTAAGTMMVKDIMKISGSSNVTSITPVNNNVYFSANDGTHGYELWKSDGTEAGTVMVKDIKPGAKASSAPRWIANVDGIVYFSADDGVAGRELWKTNGTEAGTVMVKDIVSGSASTNIGHLTNVNGTLFFSANDGVHGEELWKSNGTPSGTIMVKDLTPGPQGSGYRGAFSKDMANFTNVNGKLYFTAYKGNAYFFWKSDGTEAGTVAFLQADGGLGDIKANFTLMGGALYFLNGGVSYPYVTANLMKETSSGVSKVFTVLLNDYYSSEMPFLVRSGSGLYFHGRKNSAEGYALFRSDGTTEGTKKVIDILIIKDQSSDPYQFVKIGNTVYFTATLNDQESVWKTDGTEAGTTMMISLPAIGSMVSFKGQLYFAGYDATPEGIRWDIYKTDGTPEGTIRIGMTRPDPYSSPNFLTPVGDQLFFVWGTDHLWVTDGTTSHQVIAGSYINTLFGLGDVLYFRGYDIDHGSELWKSDGTPAGTVRVADINAGNQHSSISKFTALDNILYFIANDGVHGYEPWRSDGTAAGTYMVKDLRVNDTSGDPLHDIGTLKAINGSLYIKAQDQFASWWLYKSDGTTTGTTSVSSIPLSPGEFIPSTDRFYFIAYNSGYELWTSQGTPESTQSLAVVEPGPYFTSHFSHVTINGVLYITFDEGDLWRSDGTPCGTYTVPGMSVWPFPIEALGTEIIFAGNNASVGRELFKINTATLPPAPCSTFAGGGGFTNETSEYIQQYPNPFAGEFTLYIAGEQDSHYDVQIFNTNQTEMESHRLPYNERHTVGSSWPGGLYILKIREKDKMTVRKVIKK